MHEQSADHWVEGAISGGMYHVLAKGRTGTFGTRYDGRSDLGENVFILVPPLVLLDSFELRAKFLEVASELGPVSIEGIPRIIDFGFEDEIPFVVTQRPKGIDLRDTQSRGVKGIPPWVVSISQKLDGLHAEGFRHYDVCPEVIWCDQRERITLSDFGLGFAVQAVITGQATQNKIFRPSQYYAPELIPADPHDGRCDQFSLAMTVRWWLDPEGVSLSIDAAVDEVLRLATAPDPTARFSSCADFTMALEEAISGGMQSSVAISSGTSSFPEVEELSCPGCGIRIARAHLSESQTGRCPQEQCGLLLEFDAIERQLVELTFYCGQCDSKISSRVFHERSRAPCPQATCAVLLEVPASGTELREVLLECPSCKSKVSRGRFKQDKSITCSSCRQPLMLDASGLNAIAVPPEMSVIIDPKPKMVSCPCCNESLVEAMLRGTAQAECAKCGCRITQATGGRWVAVEEKRVRKKTVEHFRFLLLLIVLIAFGLYLLRPAKVVRWAYNNVTQLFSEKEGDSADMNADSKERETSDTDTEKARRFVEQGNNEVAMEILERVLKTNPEDVVALKLKAEIEVARKKYAEAIATLTGAVRLNINDADAYLRRAKAGLLAGDYRRTISDCTDALRTEPDLKEAYLMRGEAYEKIGNTGRAGRDRKKAGSIRSD